MTPEPEVAIPLARVKLSLSQLLVIVSFIVTAGVSWGVIQTSLQTNKEIMLRIESRSTALEAQTNLVRQHQIVNEMIIDENTWDIDRINRRLGLDGNFKRRGAAEEPK